MKKIAPKVWVAILLCIFIALLTLVPLEYLNLSITGNVVTRVAIVKRTSMNCSIPLYPGWNLVSMPCMTENSARDIMLQTIAGNYSSIHTYDISNTTDPWKSYNPEMPWWVIQDLSSISEKNGYWIQMKTNTSWDVQGDLYLPVLIPMYKGWNLVGYPYNTTQYINESLITIDGSYSAVYAYDANESKWLMYYAYLPSWVSQNLTNMSMYFGYWINMTQDDVWVVSDE
jgi:hypothetical protein